MAVLLNDRWLAVTSPSVTIWGRPGKTGDPARVKVTVLPDDVALVYIK